MKSFAPGLILGLIIVVAASGQTVDRQRVERPTKPTAATIRISSGSATFSPITGILDINDPSIEPSSNIQLTYDTQPFAQCFIVGSTPVCVYQRPLTVNTVGYGTFQVTGTGGQTFHWLAFNP